MISTLLCSRLLNHKPGHIVRTEKVIRNAVNQTQPGHYKERIV